MSIVTSQDGTVIAYEQAGSGPPVVFVSPALADRSHPAGLAVLLAERFTTVLYDRRGRGESGDTQPYAVAREVEDLEAIIDAVGGSAALFGDSSGAVLALETAARLPEKVTGLALYEPPFVTDDGRAPVPVDYAERVGQLAASGQRGDAIELFMTAAVGIPVEFVAGMRQDPSWAEMEKLAHTLTYDAKLLGDTQSGRPLPVDRWASASAPTLVLAGEHSEPFMHIGADALATGLPNGRRESLAGQDHSVLMTAPETLAPVLIELYATAR